MTDFVTIGETCAVFAATQIGRMRYSKTYEIRPGGAESTVAVGVARLGHDSTWISRVGDDELGQYLLTFIRGEGVQVACDLSANHPTGLFVRERLPRGKARHFYYRAGSAFSTYGPNDIPVELIAGAKILHLTGITPALSESTRLMVYEAMRIAQDHGVTVLFDPNMRKSLWSMSEARAPMESLLARADYVLPGLEDLQGIYGDDLDEQSAIAHLRSLGCKTIVFKRGARGAAVYHADGTEDVPCEAVADPVDLMGAGDAFAAGFAAGLLDGRGDVEAARLGNLVAGLSIQTVGNIESLPNRREVEMFLSGQKRVER